MLTGHRHGATVMRQTWACGRPRLTYPPALWFFFSFCTLFLNKYILSLLEGEPSMLGTCPGLVGMEPRNPACYVPARAG